MATSATHSPIRLPVLTPAGVLILIVPEIDLTYGAEGHDYEAALADLRAAKAAHEARAAAERVA